MDVKALEAAFAEVEKTRQTSAEEAGEIDMTTTGSIETAEEPAAAAPVVTTVFNPRAGDGTPSASDRKILSEMKEDAAAGEAGAAEPVEKAETAEEASAPTPTPKTVALTQAGEGTPTKSDRKLIEETRKGAETKAVVLKGGEKYQDIVAKYASAYGVPVQLAHAVIRIESNYRANATGRAGEVGLMQIKPSTARMMGYSGSAKGLYSPETNIKFGMKYLGKAHELGGGTTCGTILRYNAGHGAKRMNPVSAAYCSKIKRHLGSAA